MRVALHRVESDCFMPIYDNEISKEETLELVVPDVNADIGKILDVRGQFLLSSQKAKTDEIHIGASVEVSIIYSADDSGKVQYVMANIPFDMTISVPGADENSKIVTKCELCGLDARTLNPRKLLLRADVSVQVSCYVPDKFVLWDNLCEGENAPVHILQKEIEHTLIIGVREKSFVVSDEYRLPADKGQNVKMLSANTEICVQDAKAVGNKVVIKALANTTSVFLNEDDGCLFDCMFTSQFSQIIEVDAYGDNIDNSVFIKLKDAEFTMISSGENGYICSASLHMIAQVISKESKTSTYIADAYSNEYKLIPETIETKIMRCSPRKTLVLNLRGKLQPKVTLTEILYATVSEICTETDGGEISCHVNVGGVGRSEDDEFEAIELKLSAEEKIELLKNQRINIASVCCEKPTIMGMAQNAEINIDVTIEYCIRECSEIAAVCCLEICEDCPEKCENSPSIVVFCSEKQTDLWSLAKKYGSTMELIISVNSVNEEFSISRRPLLIPKAT